MALGYLSAQVNAAGARIAARGTDSEDADLGALVDAALVVPAIDADVTSEAAVEAIRTAYAAHRAQLALGNVVVRYDTGVTANQLAVALERLLREVRVSGLLS